MSYPIGTVDGGRARIGSGLAEAVLVLPSTGRGLLALPRRDVILFFGVVGRRTPVYAGSGREVGYGVWEDGVFRIYAGEEAAPRSTLSPDFFAPIGPRPPSIGNPYYLAL